MMRLKRQITLTVILLATIVLSCFAEGLDNTYINEEYGVAITGPTGWYMEKLDLLKGKQESESFSFKRYDLVKYYKDYGVARTPTMLVQLSESYSPAEPFPGLESFSRNMINKSGAKLLEQPVWVSINTKECIKYYLEMPGAAGAARIIWAFFQSQKNKSTVILQLNAVIRTEEWDEIKPLIEEVINNLVLK